MASPRYYALIASLPRLPYFEQAEYLPISILQLESRLRALHPRHHAELFAAIGLLRWEKQPRERTTADIVEQYDRAMKVADDNSLRELLEYWMGQRTVVTALRMQNRDERPAAGVPWSAGRWTRTVQSHWDAADLGVGSIYPWVQVARSLIQNEQALELERLLIETVWRKLAEIEGRAPFGFERVVGFVFKWEFVRRWLSYSAEGATERFQKLIGEVIRGHEEVFA